jgi:hypothetical protein
MHERVAQALQWSAFTMSWMFVGWAVAWAESKARRIE